MLTFITFFINSFVVSFLFNLIYFFKSKKSKVTFSPFFSFSLEAMVINKFSSWLVNPFRATLLNWLLNLTISFAIIVLPFLFIFYSYFTILKRTFQYFCPFYSPKTSFLISLFDLLNSQNVLFILPFCPFYFPKKTFLFIKNNFFNNNQP